MDLDDSSEPHPISERVEDSLGDIVTRPVPPHPESTNAMRTNLDNADPAPFIQGEGPNLNQRFLPPEDGNRDPQAVSRDVEHLTDMAQNSERQSVLVSDSTPPPTRHQREPRRAFKIMEIAMVRGNRQAQLLSASPQAILMIDCCLQCAWRDAVQLKMRRIIVT